MCPELQGQACVTDKEAGHGLQDLLLCSGQAALEPPDSPGELCVPPQSCHVHHPAATVRMALMCGRCK